MYTIKYIESAFTIIVENKRKIDDNVENPTAKTKRLETKLKCSDLVVLNIPYTYDEQKLKEYFGQFGELLMLQVILKHCENTNIYVVDLKIYVRPYYSKTKLVIV